MKIVFITGSRADYGKLKPLINGALDQHDVQLFVTGMHLSKLHGDTWTEIQKDGFSFTKFDNSAKSMGLTIAKTIEGFSRYVESMSPDLIVVHGDRGESLAGAIVGSMTNTVVCHVEGGDVSGTVDEHLRHAISKLSHIHCVTNKLARDRLIQMGERDIHIIGSPDIEVMFSDLPALSEVKERYEIPFKDYGILIYHPVTTEDFTQEIETLVSRLLYERLVIIYPNNDAGYEIILRHYERFDPNLTRIFPSMRFEHFLSLLKYANYIVGNSSSGIMEAVYYGTPAINVGSRQKGRGLHYNNYAIDCEADDVLDAIKDSQRQPVALNPEMNTVARFLAAIAEPRQIQKQFYALDS